MKQEPRMTTEENSSLKKDLREQLEKVIGKYYCEQYPDTMFGAGKTVYYYPIKIYYKRIN